MDGWIDFVVTEWNEGFTLYRNASAVGAGNHWLTVRLRARPGVNRNAIGARVTVQTSRGSSQMQEVKSGSSLGAGNDLALHFRLGRASQATVTVTWPDGTKDTYSEVAADQALVLSPP